MPNDDENQFSEDCIHIHACKRICAIAYKKFKKPICCYCDSESCTAYQNADAFMAEHRAEAKSYVRANCYPESVYSNDAMIEALHETGGI